MEKYISYLQASDKQTDMLHSMTQALQLFKTPNWGLLRVPRFLCSSRSTVSTSLTDHQGRPLCSYLFEDIRSGLKETMQLIPLQCSLAPCQTLGMTLLRLTALRSIRDEARVERNAIRG